jgi:hypothetical protein
VTVSVLVVGKQKSFKDLQSLLFSQGTVSSAAAKRVRDALVEANPHADLSRLRPGLVLTLPDVPEIQAIPDLSLGDTVQSSLDDLVSELTRAVNAAVEAFDAADAEELRAVQDAQSAVREDVVRQQASAFDEAAAALGEAESALKNAEAAINERAALRMVVVREWSDEIQTLRALAR